MALETAEKDSRENFCRLDWITEAFDHPEITKAMLKGYQLALREMGSPMAEYLEGWEVIALEVMPDHLHLFVGVNPSAAPDQIVFRLKGYTSWILRNVSAATIER